MSYRSWILFTLGLAITLFSEVCALGFTVDSSNSQVVLILPKTCQKDSDCKNLIGNWDSVSCDLETKQCFCKNGYVEVSGKCLRIVHDSESCIDDKQCIAGFCAERKCECMNARCNLGHSVTGIADGGGMGQVVLIIAVCIITTVVTCLITITYRRCCSRTTNQHNRLNSDRLSSQDVQIQLQTVTDGPPPLYDEVVIEPPKSNTDPPSYSEYLEIQRSYSQDGLPTLPSTSPKANQNFERY